MPDLVSRPAAIQPLHPALSLDGVHKAFRAGVPGCSAAVAVLRGVTLRVSPGEIVAVVGSAGAGKTTLLLCAAGMLRPDAGVVRRAPADRTPAAVYIGDRRPAEIATLHEALPGWSAGGEGAKHPRPLPLRHGEVGGALGTSAERARGGSDLAAALLDEVPLLLIDDAPAVLGARASAVARWTVRHRLALLVAARDPRAVASIATRTLFLEDGVLRPDQRRYRSAARTSDSSPAARASARSRST